MNLGLWNGSQGVVKVITHKERETAPLVPKYVLVDFGDSHTGESFFLIIAMGLDTWKNRVFNDDNVKHMYFTNKLVNEYNNEMAQKSEIQLP